MAQGQQNYTLIVGAGKENVKMKDIRIIRLTLDNFKGQRHFELTPDGNDCSIYGDNAAGKTTLYDGLTWLLFGKDSRGQSNFEIKPLGPDGQVLDHAAVTSVEAVLQADNDEITLRKTYYEKWSTKRGSAAETFDGHSSDFFVDGVPVKKYEFERRVSELVDEELFRTLTNVTHFCSGMDWHRRRSILFEVGQVVSDAEIMAGNADFAPLAEAMGKLSLDDYKKKLLAERKGLIGVRNDVPVRLDECQKTVNDIRGIDFDALKAERDSRAAKREALAEDLRKLSGDTFMDTRRNDRDRLRNELNALEQENTAHRAGQEAKRREAGALAQEIAALERSLLQLTDDRRRSLARAEECDAEVEHCRVTWKEINARQFSGASCPVCARPLEGDLLAAAKERFQAEKDAELGDVVQDSERFKKEAARCRERADEIADEAAKLEGRISELREKVGAKVPEVEDLPDYSKRRAKLADEIRNVEDAIARHAADGAAVKEEINRSICSLDEEIGAINGTLAKQAVLDFTLERMETLRADAAAAAEKLESLDKMIFLIEDFVRYKTRYIEESINGRFALVRWKLFEEQVNGGVAECCEATVNGVPYGSLNSGMRINAGIDVIGTMSAHYGVSVPLVVDNAETVTALRPLDAQVIRLMVSEQDKKLRCEYGT